MLAKIKAGNYDVVCAHSLGSLICYDTFLRDPKAIRERYFVSFGSKIGNPFVRNVFAGRLEPLAGTKMWFHLFNPEDRVFTADIRLAAGNFEEIGTAFDVPNDMLNHDATWYLSHRNAQATVWRDISGARIARVLSRSMKTFHALSAKPTRRALLVGINAYPDAANRLEGCVNEVFLMSSVLQESGFESGEIRVVLNDRATTANLHDRLHWLLDGVRAGDERVLFYSGQGAQMPVYGASDEVDHMDECVVPFDFDWTAQHALTDKQFVNFYSQLPYESYFAAILDCCHSGGMTREGGGRVRGITPPDDIRHRALRWNAELQMWEDRPLPSPNPSLMKNKAGESYLGASGARYRIGRAIGLRALPQKQYDAVRRATKHNGPYLPVIMEACQENPLSYEYRHGVQSYGAFTFSLPATLRASRSRNRNPTFIQLMDAVDERLRRFQYDQTPSLVGASKILHQPVPWTGKPASTARSPRQGRPGRSGRSP